MAAAMGELTGDVLTQHGQISKVEELTAGADPALEKGWGTPDKNGGNSKINDIHDLLT